MILRYEIFPVITYFGCSKCNIFNNNNPSTIFYTIPSSPLSLIFLILYGFLEWSFFFFFLPARGNYIGLRTTFPKGKGFWSMAVNWLYIDYNYKQLYNDIYKVHGGFGVLDNLLDLQCFTSWSSIFKIFTIL